MESFLIQIGIIFFSAAIAALISKTIKLPLVLGYIGAGFGLLFLDPIIDFETHTIELISELGIILLLFLAGMEVNLKTLKDHGKYSIATGFVQIAIFTGIGYLIGLYLLDVTATKPLIFFGLCLAFSSTIVVIGLLEERKELKAFHGQILLGILIVQDIVAIFALLFLNGNASIGSVATLLATLLLYIVIAWGMAKYLLKPIFRKLAESRELLFVGTLGFVLGIVAISEWIHFSAEMGAFIVGVALANIPYKLEIEDKIEPIKSLGVVMFFVALGLKLNFTGPEFMASLPEIGILTIIALFLTPVVLILFGWIQRLKSRPSFYIGVMLNQISEFSLIVAVMAYEANVFSGRLFLIITASAVLSIVGSALINKFRDELYKRSSPILKFLDRHALRLEDQIDLEKLPKKDHIILMGYNEINDLIADQLAEEGVTTVIVDLDPDKVEHVKEKESKQHRAVYADPLDPDIWEDLHFADAKIIVSGLEENQQAELALMRFLAEQDSNAKFVVHTGNYEDAKEMYNEGADFVLMPEYISAEYLSDLIVNVHKEDDQFNSKREQEFNKLEKYEERYF